ncbi:solute carrier family 22 member 13 [Myripristis murdjan]|uniref:solute carrier family 22 member 13 n=1 Tax=Myripristis murdjan TaxID=586833 RepID=UPI001175E5D7|nr:solute carrier family 22 member 13-like [Myripristis murdjan]
MSPLQLSVYCRLSLVFIFTSFLFFLDVFTAATAAATCHHGNRTGARETIPPKSNQSQPGEVWEGEADWRNQRRDEDSVCMWTDWLPYGQTLYMIGLLLGSLFGGAVSDRYGKRPVLLVCVCVHAVCGVLPAVLPQPLLFLAVRCLTGVCCCCINMCSFSLAVEWSPAPWRLWPPALLSFCFSVGTMIGAPLAWLSPSWRQLHLSLSLPQVLCLPVCSLIPESPRWLLLKRRMDVLDRYRGNSPADKQCLEQLLDTAWSDMQKAPEVGEEPRPPADHAPCDISHLKHPTILLRLSVMSYLSFASALTYYGICLNVGSFGVGVYSAQFFSGLSEAPCLLVPFLLARWGRRPISMLALFLSGAACFLSLLLGRYHCDPVLVISFALFGKLCMLTVVFVSLLYGIELFPTVIRQRCVSLVNLCFRVGCLLNSVVTAGGAISLAAMLLYASGPVLGCFLLLLLPETRGLPLPDSLQDCDRQLRPRPPSLTALWRRRQLVDDSAGKMEMLPGEKSNTDTSLDPPPAPNPKPAPIPNPNHSHPSLSHPKPNPHPNPPPPLPHPHGGDRSDPTQGPKHVIGQI